MDKEQKVAEIKEELARIAKTRELGKKVDVWKLFKILGVDERIINNPNPNNLGMGIDFDNYIQALIYADVIVNDDGSVLLKTDRGKAYLIREGMEISGMEVSLCVNKGEVHMVSSYKRGDLLGYKDVFDMMIVPYQKDYMIRSRTASYGLQSTYNPSSNKYDTLGGGLCTISDYDRDGIERWSSRVSYGNTPDIYVNPYSGINLDDVIRQESFVRNSVYHNQELSAMYPTGSLSDKTSFCFCGESIAKRGNSLDEVVIGNWNRDNYSWDFEYHLALTGEYDMSRLFNNSEKCSTPEELASIKKERLSEGWYERKIEQYRQNGGTTANVIAQQLEQEKLRIEKTRGMGL